ncbi:MAG: protein translocase subunit SecD [Nitrospinota bacterium]
MNRALFWRVSLTLLVAIVAMRLALPLDEKINLGLDLQGGMHLVYEVDLDVAIKNSIDTLGDDIEKDLATNNIKVSAIRQQEGSIVILLATALESSKAKEVIAEDYSTLTFTAGSDRNLTYRLTDEYLYDLKAAIIDQALETLRNRIDQFGVSEPLIQSEGNSRILIQLPGIKDRERAIALIGKTASLEFRMLDTSMTPDQALAEGSPFQSEILYQQNYDQVTKAVIGKSPYLVKRKVELTGDTIKDAQVRINQFNQPYVSLDFNLEGSRKFSDVTAANVGKNMAIVLDDSVYSAPVIREQISGGSASIEGGFSYEEAKDLAIVLKAGALPAPLIKLEERSVGPSLGRDSIERGIDSILIGSIFVLIFMIIFYKISGIIADIALIFNMVILAGALSYFDATLTLPGIAGVILTIGIAVDANVLIFERIKEELRIGKTIKAAVDSGYSKALLTIVDANATTLIAAVVLFQFGTGPIKGFAVTLTIGILASMFTSIYGSRIFFIWYLQGRKSKKLSI